MFDCVTGNMIIQNAVKVKIILIIWHLPRSSDTQISAEFTLLYAVRSPSA